MDYCLHEAAPSVESAEKENQPSGTVENASVAWRAQTRLCVQSPDFAQPGNL